MTKSLKPRVVIRLDINNGSVYERLSAVGSLPSFNLQRNLNSLFSLSLVMILSAFCTPACPMSLRAMLQLPCCAPASSTQQSTTATESPVQTVCDRFISDVLILPFRTCFISQAAAYLMPKQ